MNGRWRWVVLLVALLASCQSRSSDSATGTAEQPAEQPGDGSQQVSLVVASWEDVQQRVAASHGKVVVVDLWSTSCLPCLREFPELVKLATRFPDDVVCVSVNLDYIGLADEPPDSLRAPVLEFLQDQQAGFQNILSSDTDEYVMETAGAASIPVVMVYARDGSLLETFKNDDGAYGEEFTYPDHVVPRVEKAVAVERP